MANNRQTSEQNRQGSHQTEHNGYAKDIVRDVQAAGKKASTALGVENQQLQGYAFLVGGTLLFLHTIGYFAILNWILMVGAVALILYGAKLVNLWDKAENAYNYLREKYEKERHRGK